MSRPVQPEGKAKNRQPAPPNSARSAPRCSGTVHHGAPPDPRPRRAGEPLERGAALAPRLFWWTPLARPSARGAEAPQWLRNWLRPNGPLWATAGVVRAQPCSIGAQKSASGAEGPAFESRLAHARTTQGSPWEPCRAPPCVASPARLGLYRLSTHAGSVSTVTPPKRSSEAMNRFLSAASSPEVSWTPLAPV